MFSWRNKKTVNTKSFWLKNAPYLELWNTVFTLHIRIPTLLIPCPAEPGYALPLQTKKKPTDLDLQCLPFSM